MLLAQIMGCELFQNPNRSRGCEDMEFPGLGIKETHLWKGNVEILGVN